MLCIILNHIFTKPGDTWLTLKNHLKENNQFLLGVYLELLSIIYKKGECRVYFTILYPLKCHIFILNLCRLYVALYILRIYIGEIKKTPRIDDYFINEYLVIYKAQVKLIHIYWGFVILRPLNILLDIFNILCRGKYEGYKYEGYVWIMDQHMQEMAQHIQERVQYIQELGKNIDLLPLNPHYILHSFKRK